ncbi:MAG: HEAT repeat domain-containing protein [Planctomycetes bacterium]|nr:HEAT repeat domain-containing protein [Planctomycetota bacterium]
MAVRAYQLFGLFLAALMLAQPGPASAQEEPDEERPVISSTRPGWSDLDEVIRRWRSPGARLRGAATRAAVQRWADWTPAELARMEEVGTDPDADVAECAEAALERVRRVRDLADSLGPSARRLAFLICPVDDDRAAVAVGIARMLTADQVIPRSDLLLIEKLARDLAPDADFNSALFGTPEKRAPWIDRDLRRVLKGKSAELCAAAIREIGRLGRVEYADVVEEALWDRSPVIRRAAGVALPRLWTLDPEFRWDDWFSEDSWDGIEAVAEGVRRLGPGPLTESLVPLLKSPNFTPRFVAAQAIGAYREPRRAPRMLPLLDDRSPLIVEIAFDSIADMRPDGSIEAARRLMRDGRPLRREFGVRLAGRLKARELAQDVAKCLDDMFPRVRAAAVEAIGRLGGVEFAGEVIRTSREAEFVVRAAAVLALGRLATEEAIARIREALDDPESEVRAAAALALGTSRAAGAGERLRLLARQDSSLPVAAAATRALGLVGGQEELDALLRQLAEDAPEVGEAAADAIALAGARQLAPKLVSLTLNAHPRVANAATRALGRLAAPSDRWVLLAFGAGSVDSRRYAAALALADLCDLSGTPAEDGVIANRLSVMEGDRLDEVACAARVAMLRLGKLDLPAQRQLLEEVNGLDPPIAAELRASLSEALIAQHEPIFAAGLTQEFALDREISSIHDLAIVLTDRNLRMQSHERVIFEGRVPVGVKVTPAWLLWRAGLRGACVFEGNRVRVLTSGLVVAHWRARLAAMREK